MKEWLSNFLPHYLAYLSGALSVWTRALVVFVLVGTAIWAVASVVRRHPISLGRLVGYLFPLQLYRNVTARISHLHYLLSVFFWTPLITLVIIDSFKIAHQVREILTNHLGVRNPMFDSTWSIVSVQAAAFILSSSFAGYWIHYALHKSPFLWSFHRSHHSAEALTLPAAERLHPVEGFLAATSFVFAGLVVGLVLYFAGLEEVHPIVKAIAATYAVWGAVGAAFDHAHVRVSFGHLDRIVYTPVLHQIHHSAELRHRDKNLGGTFRLSIWDWMFGTLYLPEKDEEYRWGLNDEEYGPQNPHLTLRDFYLEPFRYAWGIVRNWSWLRYFGKASRYDRSHSES